MHAFTRAGAARTPAVLAALLITVLLAGLPSLPAEAELPGGSRIGDDESPTPASLDISSATIADGAAARVVLGRNDVFADNLAGAAAAGADGALLLVDPAPAGLDADVAAEIARLTGGPAGGECATGLDAEVILLGGDQALGTELSDDLAELGYCTDRVFGASRVETSVALAEAVLGDGPRETLLIARDDNPADSAAAGAFAAATGTPIVVTPSDSLHTAVATLLAPADDPFEQVILLGGPVALSEDVQTLAQEAAGADGTEVSRIAGASRDDTALQIALQLWGDMASTEVALVNGFPENFWTYALPGGVAAASDSAPLLYLNTDLVPSTTAGYLGGLVADVTTIGPASAISDALKAEAEGLAGQAPGIGADLRVVDLPAELDAEGSGTMTVTIEEGDISVLFMAAGTDPAGSVFIDGVTGPDGFALTADDIPERVGTPDAGLQLPQHPGQAFVPGDYTFEIFSETGVSKVQAIVKSGDAAARQEIDVDFVNVSTSDILGDEMQRQEIIEAFAADGETIMGGFGLHPGDFTYTDMSAELNEQFGTIDSDSNAISQLCANIPQDGDRRALRFAFVDNLTTADPDVTVDGLSSGLPGAVVLEGYSVNCVIIATQGPDVDGDPALYHAGPVAWHEAGHLMGLEHTTQADGIQQDLLEDTPFCDVETYDGADESEPDGEVDDVECGEAGDNFMFWTGLSTTMTADQAFMLARNPLFQPREAPAEG